MVVAGPDRTADFSPHAGMARGRGPEAGYSRQLLPARGDGALETRLTARMDTFATKADLETHRAETKADIASLRADLYRALWIQGGAIVAILTALRFLPV